MTSYVPLWCKSNFSFLEGASHPEELVETAHGLGLPALAVTDRDGVYGIVRAHVRAKELGLPLIVGAQMALDDDSNLLLLAHHRHGAGHVHPHGDRPDRELVPREQIAGEAKRKR